jgi:hypothetical protein
MTKATFKIGAVDHPWTRQRLLEAVQPAFEALDVSVRLGSHTSPSTFTHFSDLLTGLECALLADAVEKILRETVSRAPAEIGA